jgi:ubiquinone/menaquinone biosynthesis C-methylase UbiE
MLPGTRAIGSDFSAEMVAQSRSRTAGLSVSYIVADNRHLALGSSRVDTIVAVNSLIPETRPEVDLMFQEAARVLRRGGRLIALLPAFEMSLIARERWQMPVQMDMANHREWDTTGWQCFYTVSDIQDLVRRHAFQDYAIERVAFSAPEEVEHIRKVYASNLQHVPTERLLQDPLFEHLLIADR